MSVGQMSAFSSLSDDTFAVSHIGEDSSGKGIVEKRTEAKVTQHQYSQQSHMYTRCCQILEIILSLVRPLLCSFFRAAALPAVCSFIFGLIVALIKSELRCERIRILFSHQWLNPKSLTLNPKP
jgi:Na+/glutamate symporter